MSDLAEKHGKASIADKALSASVAVAVPTKQSYILVDCFVLATSQCAINTEATRAEMSCRLEATHEIAVCLLTRKPGELEVGGCIADLMDMLQ